MSDTDNSKNPCTAEQLCIPVLELVYRTYTSTQLGDEVKSVSVDIVEWLSKHVDHSNFVQRYNEVKTRIEEKRRERRAREKQLTVVDPEKAVKKRIRKQQRKKEETKRKKFIYKLKKGD